MTPVLTVAGYTLDYHTAGGALRALEAVSLSVAGDEVLGLVGESGSGKSSLAWAIMRHLPRNARERGGSISFLGEDLIAAAGKRITAIRGARIGMVFQDPATSLNPTLALGAQLVEVLRRHRHMPRQAAWQAGVELLRQAELGDGEAVMRRFPHEVSGGEKQRIVLATAFACRPDLIIFDEPTTALDAITGARVLELFLRLRREAKVAGLYISHDLALVSRVADRVAVIRRGRIVEEGKAQSLFLAPANAYTRALVAAVPRPQRRLTRDSAGASALLSVRGLSVGYARRRLFGGRRTTGARDLDLDVRVGEILGVVGESGSGKSTLARALAGLVRYSGDILFAGRRITGPAQMDGAYRRAVQIVFQHADASLNPRHRVGDIVARPLRLFGGDVADVARVLAQVHLPPAYARRYPHQLSGGEKQRVAIARAFAARPALVICDEITASLDVSVQAAVIELLLALRAAHGTAYLFITHDLNLVRQIAHRLVVMRRGSIVDVLPVEAIAGGRLHPYTRELLAASPPPVGQ
jgi:peptide/nickel transport system ATP-binding protein